MIFRKKKKAGIGYSTSTSTATTTKYSVFSPSEDDGEPLPPCPWSTSPKTVEEFLVVCDQRRLWIAENGRQPYPFWSVILTHEIVEDICRKVITMESK